MRLPTHPSLSGGRRSLTPDQERWAEALQVLKMKGDGAQAFIAERIRTLASVGDHLGAKRWREIQVRVTTIEASERQLQ